MESKANVKECEIMSNGVRGIGVQSGAELQLYKSTIGRNAQEGVFVSGNRYDDVCLDPCVQIVYAVGTYKHKRTTYRLFSR